MAVQVELLKASAFNDKLAEIEETVGESAQAASQSAADAAGSAQSAAQSVVETQTISDEFEEKFDGIMSDSAIGMVYVDEDEKSVSFFVVAKAIVEETDRSLIIDFN